MTESSNLIGPVICGADTVSCCEFPCDPYCGDTAGYGVVEVSVNCTCDRVVVTSIGVNGGPIDVNGESLVKER